MYGMFTNIYHRNLPIGGKIAFQIPTIPFSEETGWWFQPIWKILVKMGIFPK